MTDTQSPVTTNNSKRGAARPAAIPARERVASGDWAAIRADLDEYGGALTGPLLTPADGRRAGRAL